jgi:hypothetical protein
MDEYKYSPLRAGSKWRSVRLRLAHRGVAGSPFGDMLGDGDHPLEPPSMSASAGRRAACAVHTHTTTVYHYSYPTQLPVPVTVRTNLLSSHTFFLHTPSFFFFFFFFFFFVFVVHTMDAMSGAMQLLYPGGRHHCHARSVSTVKNWSA